MKKWRPAILALAAMTIGGGYSARPANGNDGAEVRCEASASCRTSTFTFTGFRGERAELYIDDELAFSGVLTTPDWTNESSHTARLPVLNGANLKLIVDGATVYDHPLVGDSVRTIYLSPISARQTDHPSPLLD